MDEELELQWRCIADAATLSSVAGTRARFLSLDSSATHLALGASTGSVYLFARAAAARGRGGSRGGREGALKLACIVTPRSLARAPSAGGPATPDASPRGSRERHAVVALRLHPRAAVVALATTSGEVHVVDCGLQPGSQAGAVLASCRDAHSGASVSSLCWTPSGECLLSGDDKGAVALLRYSPAAAASLLPVGGAAKAVRVWQLRAAVVQIDCSDEVALVSDTLRTSTLRLSGSSSSFAAVAPVQLGSKTREGSYGACFHAAAGNTAGSGAAVGESPHTLLAARPGRRLWLVDCASDGASGVGGGAVRATLRPGVGAASPWCADSSLPPLADDSPAVAAGPTFGRLYPVGMCALSAAASSTALVDFLGVAVLAWWAHPPLAALRVATHGCVAFALAMHPPAGAQGAQGSSNIGAAAAAPLSAGASVWALQAPDSGEALARRAARCGDVGRAARLAARFGFVDEELLLEARAHLGGAPPGTDAHAALHEYEALFGRAASQRAQRERAKVQEASAAAAAAAVFAAMGRAQQPHHGAVSWRAPRSQADDAASEGGGSEMRFESGGGGQGCASEVPSGRRSPSSLSQRSASTGAASALRAALMAALPAVPQLPAFGSLSSRRPAAALEHDARSTASSASSRVVALLPLPAFGSLSGAGAMRSAAPSRGESPSPSPASSRRPSRPASPLQQQPASSPAASPQQSPRRRGAGGQQQPGGGGGGGARLGHAAAAAWTDGASDSAPPSPRAGAPPPMQPRGEFAAAGALGAAAHAAYAPRETEAEEALTECDGAAQQPASTAVQTLASPAAVPLITPLRRVRRRLAAARRGMQLSEDGLWPHSLHAQQQRQTAAHLMRSGDASLMDEDWNVGQMSDVEASDSDTPGPTGSETPQRSVRSSGAPWPAAAPAMSASESQASLASACDFARSVGGGAADDVRAGSYVFPLEALPDVVAPPSTQVVPPAEEGPPEEGELGEAWARLGGIDWPPGDSSSDSDADDEASAFLGDSIPSVDQEISTASRLLLLGHWASYVDASAGDGDAAVALHTMAADAWSGSLIARRRRAARRRLWAAEGGADALQDALASLDATHLIAWLRVWLAARDAWLDCEADEAVLLAEERACARDDAGAAGSSFDTASEDGASTDEEQPPAQRRLACLERRLGAAAAALRLDEPASAAAAHTWTASSLRAAEPAPPSNGSCSEGGEEEEEQFQEAREQFWADEEPPEEAHLPPWPAATSEPASLASLPGGIALLADQLLQAGEDAGMPEVHGRPGGYWRRAQLLGALDHAAQRCVLVAACASALGSASCATPWPPAATAALLRLVEDAAGAVGAETVLGCATEALDSLAASTRTAPARSRALDAAAAAVAVRLMALHSHRLASDAAAAALLEPLDAHLWAPPAPAMGSFPQLRAVLRAELSGDAEEQIAALPFVTRRADGSKVLGFARGGTPIEPFLEERGHWGVRVRLRGAATGAARSCRRCCQPLLSQPSCQLLAFPCGHAFHALCLPEQACVTCMAAEFPRLPEQPP